MRAVISKSKDKSKKYDVIIGGKKIKFGSSAYDDYTTHKDLKRKENYIKRHQKREDWSDKGKYTPGFWSRWFLWNKPTKQESMRDIKNRFNIDITYI